MNTISTVGEHCFGCTACKHLCPVGCIRMEPDEKGFLYPIVDEARCIDCGLCLQACPAIKGEQIGAELFPDTLVYAAKHQNDQSRSMSASGGAFTAISDYILEKHGVVYGAGYDTSMKVCHMRTTSSKQRDLLRGSKYVQSDLGNVYKEVQQDLKDGRNVLFTGTPCQVAGLRAYLQTEYEKLLLVDLLCYGVPSAKIFSEYVAQVEEQEGKPLINCTFRDKSKGWRHLLLNLDFGSRNIVLDAPSSPYYNLFLKGTILRPSCYACPFCSFDRPGDITIGDFWGIEDSLSEFEDEKGVSLVLVNSQKGEHAFQGFSKHLEYIRSTHEACLQPAVSEPTPPSKDEDAFWQEYASYGYPYITNKYGRP